MERSDPKRFRVSNRIGRWQERNGGVWCGNHEYLGYGGERKILERFGLSREGFLSRWECQCGFP